MTVAIYRPQPASYIPAASYNAIPEECIPPSSSPGDPFRPSVELSKPVYEVDSRSPVCTVTGEIELDTSLFRNLAYSIGIAFSVPGMGEKPIEWNQDPTHTPYNRPRSFIQMGDRLIVDNTCFLKFKIDVPPSLFPETQSSQVFSVDVKCYALQKPEVATKPTSVQFMIMNRSGAGRRMSVAA